MKAQLAAGSEELRVRFNGNTAANYKRGVIGSRWGAGGTTLWFNQTDNLNSIETNGTQNSGFPTTLVLHVYDYASTDKVKAFQGLATSNRSEAEIGHVQHIVGAWNVTDAITSVSFIPNGTPNSISIGSIYGIG
jgi:hypothetical protein